MRLSYFQSIILSGLLWFIVGLWLLIFGLGLIGDSLQAAILQSESAGPLLSLFSQFIGGIDRSGVVLVAGALLVGYFKSRFIFKKTVNRVTRRILSFSEPLAFSQIYSRGYLILIASMMLLGMSLKWISVPGDLRGFVDVAIGSALLNGSMLFFRSAFQNRRAVKS